MDFSVKRFLHDLRSYLERSKEDVDHKIMVKVNHWRVNRTPSYLAYIRKGKNDVEYLAHMFARAGVDQEDAKMFIHQIPEIQVGIEQFVDILISNEYGYIDFDEKFRKIVSK